MKKIILTFVAAAFLMPCVAQQKQLSALFSYASFALANGSPYIETYLSFDAWNMNFKQVGNQPGKYQATVDITLSVKKSDSLVYSEHRLLNSPIVSDTAQTHFNFMDIQRFMLNNGIYDLTFTLKDINSNNIPEIVTENILVNVDNNKPMISSLLTLSNITPTKKENILSRSGYDMEPYINDFYPEQLKALSYYYEIYNINKEVHNQEFLTLAFVEEKETGRRIESFTTGKKQKSATLIPVVGSMDISLLPSGNYNLVVEVRNRDNGLILFQKIPFVRSNPSVAPESGLTYNNSFASQITDENILNYYISALYPIENAREEAIADKLVQTPGQIEEKQAFLFNFWKARNAMQPEEAWRGYRERMEYVAANFSYPKTPGYKTDRGRVYLQYGPPDHIRDEKNFVGTNNLNSKRNLNTALEVSTMSQTISSQGHIHYLPYQLWRYNHLFGDDMNRVFLFWDEQRSGYYKLLNSNAKGEVMDPLWERRLSQKQLSEDAIGDVGVQFNRGY